MIIDLEKIEKIEKKYENSPLSLDVFNYLILNALNDKDTTSINTLIELGCIKEDKDKDTQQLNS